MAQLIEIVGVEGLYHIFLLGFEIGQVDQEPISLLLALRISGWS